MSFSLLEVLLACAACSLGTALAMCCTLLARRADAEDDEAAPPGY